MTRFVKEMPLGQYQAGSTATVRLPTGYTYNALFIEMNVATGGVDVAEANWGLYIDEIRVMVDGDAKFQISAADMVSINKYYGHSHDAGILPIFFSAHWMRTIMGEDEGAYNTAIGIGSFSLEMDLVAGKTINSLDVSALVSSGKFPLDHPNTALRGRPIPFGSHRVIKKVTPQVNAAGEVEFSDIPRGNYLQAAAHIKDGGNITKVKVEHGGNQLLSESKKLLDQIDRLGDRAPQTNFTHVDYAADKRLGSYLAMNVNDHRIKPTFSAGPGAVPVYIESIQGRLIRSY